MGSIYQTYIILVISSILIVTVHSARAPQPVRINKCCRIGEKFDKQQNDTSSTEIPACVVGGSENWWPRIYMVQRKVIFDPFGSAPQHMTYAEATFPRCKRPQVIADRDNMFLTSKGELTLLQSNRKVAKEDFCVEKDIALVCDPNDNGDGGVGGDPAEFKKLTKVYKCCGPMRLYEPTKSVCEGLPPNHKLVDVKILENPSVSIVYGLPKCQNNDYVVAGKFNVDTFEPATGVLTLDHGKYLQSNQYCLEFIPDESINVLSCSHHFTSPPEIAPVQKHDIRFVIYAIGLLISVIFLIATLFAGYLVPSNHHVLHWRCQKHYVECLLCGFLLLAITQISAGSIQGPFCIASAVAMHFFFLAAFFWLNTMCFNIWWTFRDFRPTSLEKGQEVCRLRMYRAYAWGVPFLFASVAFIFDQLPKSDDEGFLRPRFGETQCWFYGEMEQFTYFFAPIGILLCINLLLFASTARQLTCGLWKRDDVKSSTERAALGRVCLKLVVVMGVTWVADVMSWAIGGPHYAWIVTDLINALQGVFIFIVVGCQPQVWSAIKRFWTSKTGRNVNTVTNGPLHSSSSHGMPSMGESITNNTFTNTTTTTSNTGAKIPMETIC